MANETPASQKPQKPPRALRALYALIKSYQLAKKLIDPFIIVALGAALTTVFPPLGFAVGAYGIMKAGWNIAKFFDPSPNEKGILWQFLDRRKERHRQKQKEKEAAASNPSPEPKPKDAKRQQAPEKKPVEAKKKEPQTRRAPDPVPRAQEKKHKAPKAKKRSRLVMPLAVSAVAIPSLSFFDEMEKLAADAKDSVFSAIGLGAEPKATVPVTPVTAAITPAVTTATDILNNTTLSNETASATVVGPNPLDPDAPIYNPLPADLPINRCGCSDEFYNAILEALTKIPENVRKPLLKNVKINVGKTMSDIHPGDAHQYYLGDTQSRFTQNQQSGSWVQNPDGTFEINIAEYHFSKELDLSGINPVNANAADQAAEQQRYLADVEKAATQQGMYGTVSESTGWTKSTPQEGAGAFLHETGHFWYFWKDFLENKRYVPAFEKNVAQIHTEANATEHHVHYFYTNNGDTVSKGTEAAAECTEEYLSGGLSNSSTTMRDNFPDAYNNVVRSLTHADSGRIGHLSGYTKRDTLAMNHAEVETGIHSTTAFDSVFHLLDANLGALSHTVGTALSSAEHSIATHIDFHPSLSGLKIGATVGLMYLQYYDPEQYVGSTLQFIGHKVANGAKKGVHAGRKINRSLTKYAPLEKLHKKKKANADLPKVWRTPAKTPKPFGA